MITNEIIPIWIMILICILLCYISIKNKKTIIIYLIIITLLFIINLRIMIPNGSSTVFTNNLDILFVIDNTISMQAEDYNGNETRMSAVKKDCDYIINKFDGAKYALIIFDNEAEIRTPYTYDTEITSEIINSLRPLGKYSAMGTSLNLPIDTMKNLLNKANKDKTKKHLVFFISDGEMNKDTLESYSSLKKLISNGAVLGYGTSTGGKMKASQSGYDEDTKEYVEDKSSYPYTTAISKIDETNLKKIASDLNLDYIHMTKQENIKNKINEINKNIDIGDSKEITAYKDTYYYFSIPLIILLLYLFFKYKKDYKL